MRYVHATPRRALGVGLASVVLMGALLPTPIAAADGDVIDSVICAVSSFGLKKLATTLFRVKNPEGLLMAVVGAAASPACNDLLKQWKKDQPGTLGVDTGHGLLSQTLNWRDLATELPTQLPATVSRERQCSGWVIPAYFRMCVQGQLDPIYG